MIREQHEFKEGWCVHCGAKEHPQMTATCLSRDVPNTEVMPEPARRIPACEDGDTISRRLAELRAEQQAAWNEPAK